MNILVTGGAGYIGSLVTEQLILSGAGVVVYDNLSQGHRAAVHPQATFVQGDLADRDLLEATFARHEIDAVMHFAGNTLVGESVQQPFLYLGDNVRNGLNLFEAAVNHGVRRFILSSTANLFEKPRRFPNPRFIAAFGGHSMPETGDNVANDFGISREAADRFALGSQQRFEAARAAGFFDGEIHSVAVPTGRKTPPLVVSADEHPRPETTAESLARLRPLFEGGVVTAGNASGVNDGAAALLVGSRAMAAKLGKAPMARILSSAAAGVAPRIMGVGPAYAVPKALERAGLTLADVDLIEINEAFASQVLGCLHLLGVDANDARVNPNGGAIALGHPLGASGARLALTAARELARRDGRYAVVSLCIGLGQGLAMVIERC